MAKKATAAQEKALAEKGNTALAEMPFMNEDAGAGFEDTTSEDFAIPFLRLLQKLSPAVDETSDQYVANAKPGMLINTVNKELFAADTGAIVIPVMYERSAIEWKTRKNGGGFVAKHEIESGILETATYDEDNGWMLPNGNMISDTRSFYALVIGSNGFPEPCLVSMSSSQIKKSKQWLSQMNGLKINTPNGPATAPMFSSMYQCKSAIEQKGYC